MKDILKGIFVIAVMLFVGAITVIQWILLIREIVKYIG